MDLPAIRRLLLDMLATAVPVSGERLSAIGEDDWQTLDAMAAQHRVQPILHARMRSNPQVPDAIAERWKAAHRERAFVSLAQRAELAECCKLLADNGFTPVALKGAWLAWHAYPEAAQRPLRDIDLLLTPETTEAAYNLLLQCGYVVVREPEMPIADLLRLDKHMPLIAGPRGTVVELHHAVTMPDGRLDHASPDTNGAAMRARAVTVDGIAYPAPGDMLAHLIVHAVYDHRLNCGPLVLTDIAFLLHKHAPDWPSFWQRAEAEGWLPGAAMLFALVRQYHGADAAPQAPGDVPDAMLAAAPDLLLQDLDTRKTANFAANALKRGPAGLVRRMTGSKAVRDGHQARREMDSKGGFFGWAGPRLRETLADLIKADVRQQSQDLARLSKWLDEPTDGH